MSWTVGTGRGEQGGRGSGWDGRGSQEATLAHTPADLADDQDERLDLYSAIIAYEQGDLDGPDILAMFADLIKTGHAWILQGSYGRQAAAFIDAGVISPAGTILTDGEDY